LVFLLSRDFNLSFCLYYICPVAEGVDVKVRALVPVMIQVPRVVGTCFLKNELIILYEVVFLKAVKCSGDM
jgi:hypothetical protein